MAWITLTAGDLAERMAGPEYDAVRKAATGTYGQEQAQVLADTVAEVRGRVAACARNRLGPAGTVPEELRGAALAIFRWRFLTRVPGLKALLTDARKAEYDDALRLLEAASACRFAVEQPEEPVETDTGTTAPSIADRPSHWGYPAQEGL